MATNLLGTCLFASITLAVKPSTWAKLLSCALGRPVSKEELLQRAEAVINLERLINARFGFSRKDDSLPARFTDEPGRDGRGAGEKVNLAVALDSFYDAMGWDRETACPKKTPSAGSARLDRDRLRRNARPKRAEREHHHERPRGGVHTPPGVSVLRPLRREPRPSHVGTALIAAVPTAQKP
jgi:hypothetical protein